MFGTLPTALRLFISPLLLFSTPINQDEAKNNQLTFYLQQQHTITNDAHIVFADVGTSLMETRYILNTKMTSTFRPSSQAAYRRARSRAMRAMQSEADLGQVQIHQHQMLKIGRHYCR